MASVTNVNRLPNKGTLAEVLCCHPLFEEPLPVSTASVPQSLSTSLKDTLTSLQSTDLEAIATALRNVVGHIDTLLLERQLAKCGYDVVRAVPCNTKSASFPVIATGIDEEIKSSN